MKKPDFGKWFTYGKYALMAYGTVVGAALWYEGARQKRRLKKLEEAERRKKEEEEKKKKPDPPKGGRSKR